MTEVAVPLGRLAKPDAVKSIGCAACGDCCSSLSFSASPADLALWRSYADTAGLPDSGTAVVSATVTTAEGVEVDLSSSGVRNVIWAARHFVPLDMPLTPAGRHWYRCDALDPETRLCTRHEDRPDLCRGFPWYGALPSAARADLPERCSHWRDLPPEQRTGAVRPLIPVESVVRRRERPRSTSATGTPSPGREGSTTASSAASSPTRHPAAETAAPSA